MRPVGAVAEQASKSPFDDGESTDGRARRELWKGKKANCPQTPREKGTRGAGAAVHGGDRMLGMGGGSRAGRLAQSTVLDGRVWLNVHVSYSTLFPVDQVILAS